MELSSLPTPLAHAIVTHATLSVADLVRLQMTGKWVKSAICIVRAPQFGPEIRDIAGLAARLLAAGAPDAAAVFLVGDWRVCSILDLARDHPDLLRHLKRIEFAYFDTPEDEVERQKCEADYDEALANMADDETEEELMDYHFRNIPLDEPFSTPLFAELLAAFPHATLACRKSLSITYDVEHEHAAVVMEPRVTFLDIENLTFPSHFPGADAGAPRWDSLRRFHGKHVLTANVWLNEPMEEAMNALEQAADSGFRAHTLHIVTDGECSQRTRIVRALCRIALDNTTLSVGALDEWPILPSKARGAVITLLAHPRSYARLERVITASGIVPKALHILVTYQDKESPMSPHLAPLGRVLSLGIADLKYTSAASVWTWGGGPCPLLANAHALEKLHLTCYRRLSLSVLAEVIAGAVCPVLRDIEACVCDDRCPMPHAIARLNDALSRLPSLRSVRLWSSEMPSPHEKRFRRFERAVRRAVRLPGVDLRVM